MLPFVAVTINLFDPTVKLPVTPNVLDKVVAPVTPNVLDKDVAPVTPNVLDKEVAPVTPNVVDTLAELSVANNDVDKVVNFPSAGVVPPIGVPFIVPPVMVAAEVINEPSVEAPVTCNVPPTVVFPEIFAVPFTSKL